MFTDTRMSGQKDLNYLLADYFISFFGSAKGEDIKSMKQDIKRLYDN